MKTGRKPYGYYPDETAVVEVIKIKRRARKGAAGPTGAYVIARELNIEGYKSQTGGAWTGQAVAKILARMETPKPKKRRRAAAKTALTAEDFLTAGQVRQLYAACRGEREEIVIRTMIGSGLRAAEACVLQVRDLGLEGEKSQIDVRRGKGNKVRRVFISPGLRRRLLAWSQRIAGRKTLVFGMDYQRLYRLVRRVGERAGLNYLHPHVLRHTFGTILYDYKKDLLFVAEQMGHASVATTQIYAKVLSTSKLEQMSIFDSLDLDADSRGEKAETVSE